MSPTDHPQSRRHTLYHDPPARPPIRRRHHRGRAATLLPRRHLPPAGRAPGTACALSGRRWPAGRRHESRRVTAAGSTARTRGPARPACPRRSPSVHGHHSPPSRRTRHSRRPLYSPPRCRPGARASRCDVHRRHRSPRAGCGASRSTPPCTSNVLLPGGLRTAGAGAHANQASSYSVDGPAPKPIPHRRSPSGYLPTSTAR